MEKLLQIIQYIVKHASLKLDRKNLAKLIYYCDGVYFQRHSKIISGERYIRLENRPEPFSFNYALFTLVSQNRIQPVPDVEEFKLEKFYFLPIIDTDFELLDKSEIRIINKVILAFKDGVFDEDKKYPNLYENYAITSIFAEIIFSERTINTKIHFQKQKSLLSLSGKIFRVLFD